MKQECKVAATTVCEFCSRQISIYAPFISTSSLDENQNVTKVVYFNEIPFWTIKKYLVQSSFLRADTGSLNYNKTIKTLWL